MKFEVIERKIKFGKTTLAEVNKAREFVTPEQWSYLRGLFNDKRIADLENRLSQVEGELQLLYTSPLRRVIDELRGFGETIVRGLKKTLHFFR